jgi:hypothetical protein
MARILEVQNNRLPSAAQGLPETQKLTEMHKHERIVMDQRRATCPDCCPPTGAAGWPPPHQANECLCWLHHDQKTLKMYCHICAPWTPIGKRFLAALHRVVIFRVTAVM